MCALCSVGLCSCFRMCACGPQSIRPSTNHFNQATTKLPGSSTACVARLRAGGKLEVVNVGDSGLRVVRGGKLVWASGVQEHLWNCPYQLSHPKLFPQSDTVADAAVSSLQLQRGDVLVVGTDGLFDNMWEEQLLEVVARAPEVREGVWQEGAEAAREGAQALANRLVDAAAANAGNSKYRGPWAVELEQHGRVRVRLCALLI